MSKSKLWSKDFIILTFTTFLVFLTFYLLMTTLTVYSIEQFSASQTQAGLTASIFVIGALAARVVIGKYIEVIGRKKLLYGSLLLFLISSILYFVADHLNLLLIVRFIHGAAFGVSTTTMATIVMGIIPKERIGEGTSYYSLSTPLATAIGPFLGIFITRIADFDMIFIACTLFSVLSIVVMLFAKIPVVQMTKEQLNSTKGFKLQDFIEKKALPMASLVFILGISYSSIVSFLNPYAIELNLTTAASFFFIVYAVFLLVARPVTGKMLDRKGDNIVIYPALVSFTLGLLFLSQAEAGWYILIAGALVALGYGTLFSSCQAIAVKKAPRHRVGLATSTYYIAMDAGSGVGPLFVGIIVPIVGYRGMYLTMAVIVLLSILLYYFVHGKKTASMEQYAQINQ